MKTKFPGSGMIVMASLLCLNTPLKISAQNGYVPVKDSMLKVNHVAEIIVNEVWIYKGRSTTYRNFVHFDRNGRNTFFVSILDTLKMKRIQRTEATSYTVENNIGSSGSESWYGSDQMRITDFAQNGSPNGWYYFNRKGKLSGAYEYRYKDSLKSRVDFFNGKYKLKQYYLYTYGPDKKVKSNALYKANGKLKQFWDYSCDETGKTVNKSNDTLKYCTVKSYMADGTVINTTSTFNYKGEPVKYVDYRNASNQQVKYLIYQGKDEILTYKILNTYENGKQTMNYKWYGNSKGKQTYSTHTVYSLQGLILSQKDSNYRNKKPLFSNYNYTYNENGLPLSKQGFRNGKLLYTATFKYKFFRKEE